MKIKFLITEYWSVLPVTVNKIWFDFTLSRQMPQDRPFEVMTCPSCWSSLMIRQWPEVSDFVAHFCTLLYKEKHWHANYMCFAWQAQLCHNMQKSVTQIIYPGKLPTDHSQSVSPSLEDCWSALKIQCNNVKIYPEICFFRARCFILWLWQLLSDTHHYTNVNIYCNKYQLS